MIEAFLLEPGTANGKGFIDDEDVRIDGNRGGKGYPNEHARRKRPHGPIKCLADIGEAPDCGQPDPLFYHSFHGGFPACQS